MIIYFHLVSGLLHSCCIPLISLSTCSFTDVGNSTSYYGNPSGTTPNRLINNLCGSAPRVSLAPQIPFPFPFERCHAGYPLIGLIAPLAKESVSILVTQRAQSAFLFFSFTVAIAVVSVCHDYNVLVLVYRY